MSDLHDEERLGLTGNYPEGKLSENDRGECRLGLRVEGGNVIVVLGVQTGWLAFSPANAEELGKALIEAAKQARGPVHYAPYGPNANGKLDCGASPRDGYTTQPAQVTCAVCKEMSPGLWNSAGVLWSGDGP